MNFISNIQVMLNAIPFRDSDFDGTRRRIFGQQPELLRDSVDVCEVMTYHQILKRPVDWLPSAGLEVKQSFGKKTRCTLQSRPLYLDGMHRIENRAATLKDDEFA